MQEYPQFILPSALERVRIVPSQKRLFMTRPGELFPTLGFCLGVFSMFSSQSRPESEERGLPFHCNLQVHRPQIPLPHAGFYLISYSACPRSRLSLLAQKGDSTAWESYVIWPGSQGRPTSPTKRNIRRICEAHIFRFGK